MKKYILFIFIIILIVIAICYSINVNNNKKEKINNSVTINDIDNISYVMLKEETEGGYIYYKTEDKELIEEVVKALNNIQIGEKVDVMFSDDGRYYIIEYYNGTTLTYYFQSNYYNKDNVNYKTYNYDELRKIKIPAEIVNN